MLRPRGLHPSTLTQLLRQSVGSIPSSPRHVFIAVTDHYEPMWNHADAATQRERVSRWGTGFPALAADFADSRGRPPQHTFFYPAEGYDAGPLDAEHLDALAQLRQDGLGEVEVHLHHDNDTPENLRETLESFKEKLFHRHGLLEKNASGMIRYAFIHGNWALNNSRPDGRWCGVCNETTILRETGCYADFTMPSAPSNTQTRAINSIYYATDKPGQAKSHDTGVPAAVGKTPPDDSLLMIQGPLMLGWKRRKFGMLPTLENADLHGGYPPSVDRLKLWLRANVTVAGRPDWLFVKLHTHGAPEKNADMLLGEPMRRFHTDLAKFAETHAGFRYYYVTAREMANLVHQAEAGQEEPSFAKAPRSIRY